MHCGKWRKKKIKSCCELDLDRTMPNVELVQAILYTTIPSSFKWIEPLFFELSCTQTDTQTHRHTCEYSIVAVDKPQL